MAERTSRRRNSSGSGRERVNDDKGFVLKTAVQSVTALIIFLVVWGMTLSQHPKIDDICGQIRHYLTYTYDVQSVFNSFYNVQEVNDDTH